jgi:nucleoside-diphosphate-sugar epimerase
MSLAERTVLVTGASGFIGSALVARLVKEGARVRGLVRTEKKGERIAALGADAIVGDVTDRPSLRRAAAGCEIVIHAAAALGGAWARQYAVNVNGTVNVVEMAHEAGARRSVYVGSIAAYGYRTPDVITEQTPLRPGVDFYSRTKAIGEQRFWMRTRELSLEAVVVRPGMVYGPGSRMWTRTVFRLMRCVPAPMFGSGDGYAPVIYVDDVVDLLLLATDHPHAVGEAFNAAPDPSPTWRDYLGAYAAMAGHQAFVPLPKWAAQSVAALAEPLSILIGLPQPVRGYADLLYGRRIYSMAKAAALLGWRPRVTLAEGMAHCEAWLREIGELRA